MLRVTPDTNILISAFVYQRGKPYQLLQMALRGQITLTVSLPIIEEMADVLSRKFDMSSKFIAEARGIVGEAARIMVPAVQRQVIREDPADNRVVERAVSAGSDHIVSGEKNLLRLKQYDTIRILKVSDFFDLRQDWPL